MQILKLTPDLLLDLSLWEGGLGMQGFMGPPGDSTEGQTLSTTLA